jgi:hypothetical protein
MAPTSADQISLQGIQIPKSSIDPPAFYRGTSRQRFLEKSISAFAGLGFTDSFTIKQAGIIAAIDINVVGTIVVTPGTGSVASTARWPHDLIKAIRFSANGVNNIVNVSGGKLQVHRFMETGDIDDKGISQGIGGASPGTATVSGSLSLGSESWGIGSNVTSIGSGTYTVDLTYRLPVAFDLVKLLGAVFAQTSATSLDIGIDWNTQAALFTLTGNATVAASFAVYTEGIVFSIPRNANGDPVIPNLQAFHSLVQYNDFGIGQGAYESTLMGTGVGKRLLRAFWQVWNGAAPQTPLVLNETNFGQCGWRFGGNETPEAFQTGRTLRMWQERLYNTDVGAVWGFGVMDFASQWAMRDSIDEATATNLRLLVSPSVALTTPVLEVVQETLFSGAAA